MQVQKTTPTAGDAGAEDRSAERRRRPCDGNIADWPAALPRRWHTRPLVPVHVPRVSGSGRPGDRRQGEHHEEGHPPGVRRDPGDLHLRQHVHHAQHRAERRHPRRRLLATATRSTPASRRSSTPVAASPASRRATPSKKTAADQVASSDADPDAARRSASPSVDAEAGEAPLCHRRTSRSKEAPMFEAVEGLVEEHAELERGWPTPRSTPTRGSAKRSTSGTPS